MGRQRRVELGTRYPWLAAAAGITLLAAVRGWVVARPAEEPIYVAVMGWAGFGLVAATALMALGHLIRVGRLTSKPTRWLETLAGFTWLIASAVVLLWWPQRWSLDQHPLRYWCVACGVLGAVTYLADRAWSVRVAKGLLWCCAWGAVGWGVVTATRYGYYVREVVAGADFCYYVAYARDMLLSPHDVYRGAYSYFPGVYVFWRTMWWLAAGGSVPWPGATLASNPPAHGNPLFAELPTLQAAHVVTVALVALVLALVAYRRTQQWLVGLVMALAYWTFASRYEAFQGVVEPLASVPALLGMWFWNGGDQPPKRRRWAWLGLAVGWGLAVWCRQHAGLLAGGWLLLLFEWAISRDRSRRELFQLLAIPVVAWSCLVVAILWEGRGLEPLLIGIRTATTYEARGGLWTHLYHHVRNDESWALVFVMAGVGTGARWVGTLRRREPWPNELRFALVAFVGSLCALYPLQQREYYHYMLLCMPGVLLAMLLWVEPVRKCLESATAPWTSWFVVTILALPFFYTGGSSATYYFLRWRKPDFAVWQPWWQDAAIMTDLSHLHPILTQADQRVFVIPPHRVEPFLYYRIRSSPQIGYGFDPPTPEDFPWNAIDYVLVIEPQFDALTHRTINYPSVHQRLVSALPDHGFHPRVQLPTMTLFAKVEHQHGQRSSTNVNAALPTRE